jgi:methylthioribulose-1-phosphate dehydratase
VPEPTPAWAINAIVQAGRRMDSCGWVPATAGNISVRLDARVIAITRSGGHKGFLDASHVMQVDLQGVALMADAHSSAETLLHCQIYRLFPGAGAVLHGHSVPGTVLSMQDGPIRLSGYEVFKAFEGQATHDVTLEVPVVANDQDIARMAIGLEPVLAAGAPLGYFIRGHGAYVWGADMPTALARLEGLEFLLACELERRKLQR